MKAGLIGPSGQQRSLPFNAQRNINLFPVVDQQGKEPASLYSAPGLILFATVGNGPIRGMFNSTKSRLFAVSASDLYEINSNGVGTLRGTLDTSTGNILFDENPTQLVISDNQFVYTFTYATNTFAKVTDPDLPSVGTITFIDGYIAANENNSGRFFISALNNATSWGALDYATAESSPDNLLRVINAVGQLWLFGATTTEIWTNRGASSFPFARIAGAKMEVGILAPHTALALDNSVFWVGRDNKGLGIVYRANGFSPKRISTETIERIIQSASDVTNMRAYTYQEEGHVFLVLTGGGLETSLACDLSTQAWHERADLDQYGNYETYRASCSANAFSKTLVGDKGSGRIYQQTLNAYSFAGDEIPRDRIFTHIFNEDQRSRFNQLVIGYESGVGLQSGQGQTPQCSLRISRDGGRTWSAEYFADIGAAGQYGTRAVFRRLGITREMTLRTRITDPVKVIITGAYIT